MKCLKALLIILVLYSCSSDNLSNSKAEKIISECLEKEPLQRSVSIQLNNTQISGDNISKYEKLKEEGYIEMTSTKPNLTKPVKKGNDPLAEWRYEAELKRYHRNLDRNKNNYDIKITKKAKKYIENATENSDWVKTKTFKYEVDKVLEVQEIPSLNSAKVKVRYKATDITPFAVLASKDPAEFLVKDLNMTKTSNGWKYCDNF